MGVGGRVWRREIRCRCVERIEGGVIMKFGGVVGGRRNKFIWWGARDGGGGKVLKAGFMEMRVGAGWAVDELWILALSGFVDIRL